MNIYHHGAADGTSGLLMVANIMKQYKLLEGGQEVERNPHKPRGPMEQLTKDQLARQENCSVEQQRVVVEDVIKEKVKFLL